MAKKTKAATTTIRPAYQVEQQFTLSPLTVLPAENPLPQTAAEFFNETRILVHAIAFWDAILLSDNETPFKILTDDRDGLENAKPVDNGKELAEYVVHAMGLQVERLRKVIPELKTTLPRYDMIPELSGVTGKSFCEVALKHGEMRWAWCHKASPHKCEGQFITPALSKDELGTWSYCRHMAEAAANEMPWFRANLKLPTLDCEKLLNLIAVEAGRVKTPSSRNDEPSQTDIENVRSVIAGMNPRAVVQSIRKAVRDAGYVMSDTKIGRAVKILRGK